MCIRIHLPNTRHGLRAPEREIILNLIYLFHVMSELQALNVDCFNVALPSLSILIEGNMNVFVARFVCINAMYACCIL